MTEKVYLIMVKLLCFNYKSNYLHVSLYSIKFALDISYLGGQ